MQYAVIEVEGSGKQNTRGNRDTPKSRSQHFLLQAYYVNSTSGSLHPSTFFYPSHCRFLWKAQNMLPIYSCILLCLCYATYKLLYVFSYIYTPYKNHSISTIFFIFFLFKLPHVIVHCTTSYLVYYSCYLKGVISVSDVRL